MPRTLFFLTIFLILVIPPVTIKLIWLLNSQKTKGVFYLAGRGNALDQLRTTSSFIYFTLQNDTIWFTDLGNLPLKEGEQVPVVYQISNPSDAKVDSFITIWGTTLFYFGVPLLILLVTAVHPDIIPYNAKVQLGMKVPFIQVF